MRRGRVACLAFAFLALLPIKALADRIFVNLRFHVAQQDFEAGRYEKAARGFLAIADEDPDDRSGDAAKALNNAAVAMEKLGRARGAAAIHDRIVARFPDWKYAGDSLFRSAVNHVRLFEFDEAVARFTRLAADRRFAQDAHRADALWNAAHLLAQLGASGEAARRFERYATIADMAVSPSDRDAARLQAGLLRLAEGRTNEALRDFQAILKSGTADAARRCEVRLHLAEAYEKRGDHAAALAEYRRIIAEGGAESPRSPAARFVARARFRLVEARLPALARMRFADDFRRFPSEMSRFRDALAATIAAYEQVPASPDAEIAVAAQTRAGYVLELMVNRFEEMQARPCPAEIARRYHAEGCEVFQEQLGYQMDSFVARYGEEAARRYRKAVEQARANGTWDEWARRAADGLRRFAPEPDRPPRDEKIDRQLESP